MSVTLTFPSAAANAFRASLAFLISGQRFHLLTLGLGGMKKTCLVSGSSFLTRSMNASQSAMNVSDLASGLARSMSPS